MTNALRQRVTSLSPQAGSGPGKALRTLAGGVVLASFALVVSGSEAPDKKQVRDEFEHLAERLSYLSLNGVIWNRPDSPPPQGSREAGVEYKWLIDEFRGRSDPKETLLDLVHHPDPKVRTLAAVGLYRLEDPSILPTLVDLSRDREPTFRDCQSFSAATSNCTYIDQTVGDIAGSMVRFYLQQSGLNYGIEREFADYWSAREHRSHCAGWFSVQLARASRGTLPTQDEYVESIRAVRVRIDEIPKEERAWILMTLQGESGSDALVTEAELLEMAKGLGPEKLLLMLQQEIPSDDPDLQPRANNNYRYKRMTIFVLRHAAELLRRSDSEALLACEEWHRTYFEHGISDPTITPWWAVAAASLDPDAASVILHAATDRFQGRFDAPARSVLAAAMVRLTTGFEVDFVVDWFFEETPSLSSFPHSLAFFIREMGSHSNGREILARIVQDSRLSTLDFQSIQNLVLVVNGLCDEPLVPNEELYRPSHPLGRERFHLELTEAERDYPNETSTLVALLGEWCQLLRMSIPRWLDKGIESDRPIEEGADKNRRRGGSVVVPQNSSGSGKVLSRRRGPRALARRMG